MAKDASNKVRVPPQDVNAERAFLGSVMLRPDAIYQIMDMISPDDFYAIKHKNIYKAMVGLQTEGEPIDMLTVSSYLKERKLLEQAGGASYIAELTSMVPSASNLLHYAQIVRKKSVMRNLIEAAEHISELGYDEEVELDSILDKAGKKILDIASFSKQKIIQIGDTLADAWARLEKLQGSKHEIRGVPTGYKELDNILAGLQKSDLIILAARPSVGKTSLALDIARNTALKHQTKVAIFSLEMSAGQLVDRMLAAESRVDSWALRTGKLKSDEDFTLIRDSMDRLSKAPIYIDDDPNTDILRMKSVARRIKNEYGLDLIIIDYLQLLVPRRNYDSLVQQVSEISRNFKSIARELDVPVLALSQLNRNVENRGGKPKLSDLRDSGSIEQDADVVIFIHREPNADGGGRDTTAQILIEKHRNGPTGKVELFFDERRVSFSSMEKSEFGNF